MPSASRGSASIGCLKPKTPAPAPSPRAGTTAMAPATDDAELPESDVSERHRIADARIGQVIASTYRIARYIGSGGSSHVFQAEHLRLGKAFAVKLLREGLDSSRRAAQRFRREAKAIARLNSEHIVSVID